MNQPPRFRQSRAPGGRDGHNPAVWGSQGARKIKGVSVLPPFPIE